MSGDPEHKYFADGMVEDIITALSQFTLLFVIALNSSFANVAFHFSLPRLLQQSGRGSRGDGRNIHSRLRAHDRLLLHQRELSAWKETSSARSQRPDAFRPACGRLPTFWTAFFTATADIPVFFDS